MKYWDSMIAWTAPYHTDMETCGRVKVFAHPDYARRSGPYVCTAGGCDRVDVDYTEWPRGGPRANDLTCIKLLLDFHNLVLNYGIDPEAAHKALWEIDEYRKLMTGYVSQSAKAGAA